MGAVSSARGDANRINAQRSTGPRTGPGKVRSSMNAVRHGLTARCVIPGEDAAEFDALLQAIRDEIQPEGPIESEAVAAVARALWGLRRAARVEADLLTRPMLAQHASRLDAEARAAVPQSRPIVLDVLQHLEEPAATPTAEQAERRDGLLAQAAEIREVLAETAVGAAFAASAPTLDLLLRYRAAQERSLARALDSVDRCRHRRAAA